MPIPLLRFGPLAIEATKHLMQSLNAYANLSWNLACRAGEAVLISVFSGDLAFAASPSRNRSNERPEADDGVLPPLEEGGRTDLPAACKWSSM